MTTSDVLQHAQAAVINAERALDAHNAELKEARELVSAAQARADGVAAKGGGLRQRLDIANASLADAEERELEQRTVTLAGEIIRRQSSDPVRHAQWVTENVERLRGMVRSEFDTKPGEFTRHPLVTQALSLLPPTNQIDVPVYALGFAGHGTSWPDRRRRLLTESQISQT